MIAKKDKVYFIMTAAPNINSLNIEQRIAFEYCKLGLNVFITGAGGVGKSYLIEVIKKHFDCTATLSPTGNSALNINGETYHKFFSIKSNFVRPEDAECMSKSLIAKLRKVKTIILEEISMIRCDHLDIMDKKLRVANKTNKPFGGKQVIGLGDLGQLEPFCDRSDVSYHHICEKYNQNPINPILYPTSARVWDKLNFTFVLLTASSRFHEEDYISALRNIRLGSHLERSVAFLNKNANRNPSDDILRLFTTNKKAEHWNNECLDNIKASGRTYSANVSSKFNVENTQLPSPAKLSLKVGAIVVFTATEKFRRAYVNGDVGRVIALYQDSVRVKLNRGGTVTVTRFKWESFTYNSKLEAIPTGAYEQFPLRLGYGITIHKSQGMTLDCAAVDLSGGTYSNGQGYVAVSRVKTLAGLYLLNDLKPNDFMYSPSIVKFIFEISKNAMDRRESDIKRFRLESLLSDSKQDTDKIILQEADLLQIISDESWDQDKNLEVTLSNAESIGLKFSMKFDDKDAILTTDFIYKGKQISDIDVLGLPFAKWLIHRGVLLKNVISKDSLRSKVKSLDEK